MLTHIAWILLIALVVAAMVGIILLAVSGARKPRRNKDI